MLRFKNYKQVNIPGEGDALYVEGACSSNDDKPIAIGMRGELVPIAQGSTFEESDTGDIYMFDEDSKSWILFASVR